MLKRGRSTAASGGRVSTSPNCCCGGGIGPPGPGIMNGRGGIAPFISSAAAGLLGWEA
uniref:Uncharacterized protein n=1 Tax=Arundo donax TaxID=35708 RepID=A0A0A9EZF3_ARUDO